MGKLIHGGQVYAEVNKSIPKHKLIPRMTSDTAPKGSCSASYVYSGRYAYYGFTTVGNGDLSQASDFWYNNNGSGNYIQYNFDEEVIVSKIGFGVIEAANVGKTFKLQFSINGANFVDAGIFTISAVDWTWYELSIPQYCLAFRIYLVDNINVVSGIDAFGTEGSNVPNTIKFKDYYTYTDSISGTIKGAYAMCGVFGATINQNWIQVVLDTDTPLYYDTTNNTLIRSPRYDASNYFPTVGIDMVWKSNRTKGIVPSFMRSTNTQSYSVSISDLSNLIYLRTVDLLDQDGNVILKANCTLLDMGLV